MCEYCGCQAIAAIDELTREHDLVVNLIGEVRAADRKGQKVLAREILTILGPHTAVEEQGLFPALAADFPEHVAALRSEHRRIEAVLQNPGTPQELLDTLEMLRDHILKEQDGVFPAALAGLRNEDWELVDAVRARVGGICADVKTEGS
ncbi:hemerythrin domain-containing protein [Dactylosporangium sp. NPDC049140]|jgi:hemerythrin-like domain-containing protein|uniref:hemerythrin domain-containing protein n=1 Tax=Dactylosporangium sp. NPDC049140 TaxID=3155647 RepID=UPI0033CDE14D